MRIDKLQVHNFRGFSDTEIVLNGKDAIFYGVNGMGKSSILDVCNLLFSRIMQEAAQDEQITASLLGEKDVKRTCYYLGSRKRCKSWRRRSKNNVVS